MRLLSRSTGDNHIELTYFDDNSIPPYSILSHTWVEGQEITYQDLEAGIGKEKNGYTKIQFCVDKAAEDGIKYTWVDTCCIDKSTSEELTTAINSMFRWYQNAVKCYVFLSDVHTPEKVTDAQAPCTTWESAFQRSRWFKRGWTLQELLAPNIVEFFSNEGTLLGDKNSLEHEIHQITNIPFAALKRPACLSEFSIEERMSWVTQRTTLRREDKAYCLLGILEVFLPLIYGEGEEYAFRRLREEAEKRQAEKSIDLSPREIAGMIVSQNSSKSSTSLLPIDELHPTGQPMKIADKSVDNSNCDTNHTSSLVSTQEMDGNACEDRSIEDRFMFDRYTKPFAIPNTRNHVVAIRLRKDKEFQQNSSGSGNASRITNRIPYELGEYGTRLHNNTLTPQTATRAKDAFVIKGPFPPPPRPWSSAEDRILLNLMKSETKRDWDLITKMLPKRTRWACQYRYEKLTSD